MKKYFFVCLFLPVIVFGQSTEERIYTNLQKYWNYRDRLEKYFVVVDPTNAKGTNIPAIRINNDYISYSDGNGGMPYYIGFLASEYALLKMNNLDYQPTKDRLKWALDAIERLDLNAESYYRSDNSVDLNHDLNGFFMRDDVDNSIKNHPNFPNELKCESAFIGSQFNHRFDGDQACGLSENFPNSRDNLWHYLLNLALVVKLVDDPTIKRQAQNITHRVIWHLRGWSDSGLQTCWYVENPVYSGCFVKGGGEVDWMTLDAIQYSCCELSAAIQGMRWGFATAGNAITEGSGLADLWQETKTVFKSQINEAFYSEAQWIYLTNNQSKPLSRYILATIIGEPEWNQHINKTFHLEHLYDELKNEKNISSLHYEHLPLIYHILHGDDAGGFDPNDTEEINWYLNLFDELKDVNEPTVNSTSHWWPDNRLVWADGNWNYFDLCRIDFMLLHNLFWLTYLEKMHYNVTNSGVACNETNYTQNILFENSTVASGCSLIDEAGREILIKNGFTASKGSTFRAYINGTWPVYYYEKLAPNKSSSLFNFTIDCDAIGSKNAEYQIEEIDEPLIEKTVNNLSFDISPNPFNDMIYITNSDNALCDINIVDATGKLFIQKFNVVSGEPIDLSNLNNGIYIINIKSGDNIINKKIIKSAI